jgi:hypothetical protein
MIVFAAFRVNAERLLWTYSTFGSSAIMDDTR